MSPAHVLTPGEPGGVFTPATGEESEMAEPSNGIAQLSADTLVSEASACSSRRVVRADQLQGDSDRMWSIFMTTPNVLTGVGYRTLQQDTGYPTPAR